MINSYFTSFLKVVDIYPVFISRLSAKNPILIHTTFSIYCSGFYHQPALEARSSRSIYNLHSMTGGLGNCWCRGVHIPGRPWSPLAEFCTYISYSALWCAQTTNYLIVFGIGIWRSLRRPEHLACLPIYATTFPQPADAT
jgi:hypothetical protein